MTETVTILNVTHVPETGSRYIESIYGSGFWAMCHGP